MKWKECGSGNVESEVLPKNLYGRTEETIFIHKKINSVSIDGLWDEI
jgi:hypothetical protein